MKYLKYVLFAIPFSFLCFLPQQKETHKNLFDYPPALHYSDDSLRVDLLKYYKKNNYYIINDTINLKGATWYLPEGISLNIKGGLLKNGAVVGNKNTLLYKGTVFDHVKIGGTWFVPEISTSMFSDLSYENSLKDVFALTTPEIENKVFIEKGNYYLSASRDFERCLCLVSDLDVTINGTIFLIPNSFEGYSMIFINGSHVALHGKGSIIGDKPNHLGTRGEWGMGVEVHESKNVKISDITVKDCWGDCIYVGGGSNNIHIENCLLDNGRRQGVSVTSASNVYITSCTISNVEGTSPQYAIDLEPNAGETVDNIIIDKVNAINCQGGIMCYGRAENAAIGVIKIRNCRIKGSNRCPLHFEKGKSVTIEKCILQNNDAKMMIECNDIDIARVKSNTIVSNKRLSIEKTISVSNYRIKEVKNNKINNLIEHERD